MQEPDYSRLPFTTEAGDWFGYVETTTAEEAVAICKGTPASGLPSLPLMVKIHNKATADFAGRCGIEEAAAKVELGGGVSRWARATLPEDGAVHGVQFRGCLGRVYNVGRLGDFLMVHLPLEEM